MIINFRYMLLFLQCLTQTVAFKILIIAPGISKSHVIFNYRLADALISEGHDVSIWINEGSFVGLNITDIPPPKGIKTFFIARNGMDPALAEGGKQLMDRLAFKKAEAHMFSVYTVRAVKQLCHAHLNSFDDQIERFRRVRFDLAFAHPFGNFPVFCAYLMRIPRLVWLVPGIYVNTYQAEALGLPNLASYIPNVQSWHSDYMDFQSRTQNLFMSLMDSWLNNSPKGLVSAEQRLFHAPPFGMKRPSLSYLAGEVDGVFINGDRLLDFSRPLPPNVMFLGEFDRQSDNSAKSINGINLRWAEICDRKSKGLIIFSLGTIADSGQMSDIMKKTWLNAFKHFANYTIIWKMKPEDLPEDYEINTDIILDDWIPQRSLLHHSNTKLFITHGGYNSLLETTKAGVPVILVPLFIDQYANAMRAQRHRLGLAVDIKSDAFNTEILVDTISKVLSDQRYASNAKKLAAMLEPQDKLISSERLLSFNLRRLIKSDDRFLRLTAAKRLAYISYHCADVVICVLIATLMILMSVYKN